MNDMTNARNRRIIKRHSPPAVGLMKNHNIATIKKRPAMDEILSNTDRVLAVTSGTSWISSLPSKVMLPSSTSHDASPIVTSEVTDLPHPDSQTTPIISPSFTERETECSASTGPSRVSKCTRRF